MNFGIDSIKSKELFLIKITALFWVISKVISWRLWISDRLFPVLPPFEITPKLPNEVHLLLFIASFISLFLVFIFPKKTALQVLVILFEIASCLLDELRWQPWEFQYLLMFVVFVYAKNNNKQLQQLILFLIAITYIHSGLHKFNGGFLYDIWERLILKKFFHISNATISNLAVHYSGLFLGIFETSIGIGLLIFKNKKIFVYLAIVMHVFLLIFLITININMIVWPWNLAFILFLAILFLDKNSVDFNLYFFKNKFNLAYVFLIGFLPFLSYFSLYPNYLSFNLYSGNLKQLVICVDDLEQQPELKPYISKFKKNKYCQNQLAIIPNQWALNELNVPICHDEKFFVKLKKNMASVYPNVNFTFIIYQYPYKNENFIEIQ